MDLGASHISGMSPQNTRYKGPYFWRYSVTIRGLSYYPRLENHTAEDLKHVPFYEPYDTGVFQRTGNWRIARLLLVTETVGGVLKTPAQTKVCLLLKDWDDLEHTTYVRRVKPDNGSGEERRAADIRGVFVLKAFTNNFEEPFGVHEWGV